MWAVSISCSTREIRLNASLLSGVGAARRRYEAAMSDLHFTFFDTALGPCALAWGEAGIVGAQLPERDFSTARARLRRRFPDAGEAAPPAAVEAGIEAIRALLAGETRDLSDILLDMRAVPEFSQKVYAQTRKIPPGETRTYGEIARALGDVALSREVGAALGKNPFPILVPCHRVLAANGKTGGFSAPGGVETKMLLLNIERARTTAAPLLFDDLPMRSRRS